MEPTYHTAGKKYEKGAAVTFCMICFILFIDFIGILLNHDNLVSDLIPDSAVIEIDKPLVNQGIFISLFLLISVIFRAFNKIKLAFMIDIVNLLGFSFVASLSY